MRFIRAFCSAISGTTKKSTTPPKLSSNPSGTKCDKQQQQKQRLNKRSIAIVTGAAEGIGFAIVRELLKNGIGGVTMADVNHDKGLEAIKELTLEFGGDKLMFVEGDVAQSKQFDWVFKKTIQNYERVDLVVNNAGIMNDVNWEGQMSSNLSTTVVGTLLGMQYMSKTCFGAGGTIINMASIMGLIPSSGYPIHTLTQYGVVGFSRAIGGGGHFDRTGVKVVVMCPGLTCTKLMKQAPYHAINDKFRMEFKDETGGCKMQKPESVAEALVTIFENSADSNSRSSGGGSNSKCSSGSVWVVENDQSAYEIQFPEVADMRFKNKC